MKTQAQTLHDSDFLFLKIKNLWIYFKSESLAFKSICAYMFVEMFRPQSIFTFLDFLPWAKVFLILAMVGIFFDERAKFRFSGMHALLILFTFVINLSIVGAFNKDWSFEYYFLFIQWIIIFFVLTTIVTTRERFYILFLVFFLCALKVAIGTSKNWAMRGFGFTSWGLKGPSGYFENSGELAILMLILFPIGFYLYRGLRHDVRTWEKLVLLAATVCPVLTILGASSRGAQLALLVQLFVMFWRQIFKPKVIIGILVTGYLGWQVLPAEQKERFTTIGEDKSSMQRELYWENGWEMMKDHPALGVGYFNFRPYFETYYPEDVLYDYAELPHNIFIQIGTDAGFAGLFVYLLIISTSLMKKRITFFSTDQGGAKSDAIYHHLWPALKVGIIGFVIAGQFVTVGYYPFLWLSIALQTALINSTKSKRDNFVTKPLRSMTNNELR
ncbi:O-antigen ligase family protein [Salinimonas iocasae]|uniref:O-glycosylation ligase, exosortase A system-associated n=1 Tax=Salinimonas iocasae TaxID=2572577 RepID=A0A5B7YBP9_9ALTE|nr:O-antigen ligase family protein [Salinimonas iocasae]QCZ92925.1 hypothetical protein FBQ74_05220 [Salinimonas iocasae]